ncbi:hypothetical protein V1512DRAFT_276148 [Lipomyces arxii]|uniref:uncharacterized protein n=1 Tax=Lipomyces arxii TaxID=56418 RepID=UPI0034CD77E9
MLEGLVASLLNRFLGAYVKNFDPKQLNIGIWSGDVKLRNLELKREALDKFRLPIDVVEGHLGELTLQIPWSNLKNKPVKIFINNVFVLAVPKANQEYDEAEEERRKQLLKMEKLEDTELLLQAQPVAMTAEEQKKNQSFTESLVTKIIDNLQITVKNIHFRYEDTISAPGHPFALGVTLAEFSAVSADQTWNPIFIQDNVLTTHKLSKLENLAIYWNTDSEMLNQHPDLEEILAQFAYLIPHDKAHTEDAPPHQYVLKPVSGQGRITIHKGSSSTIANTKAELFFDELGFVLDEFQYRDALMMVDLFHFYIRTEQFKNLRPKVSVEENPREWFRFAGNVILREIHEKRRQWSWEFFKQRRDDRLRYIELFKIKVLADPTNVFTQAMGEELKALEWKLSFEDIRFYRSLAKTQLRKERRKPKMIAGGNSTQPKEETVKRGWWDWARGSSAPQPDNGAASPSKEAPDDSAVMTEQQRKELYDAIEWDEERKPAAELLELPRDAVKLQLKVSLTEGSFALKRDPHGAATEILKLLFDTFSMDFLQRPDSFFVDLSLQELKVHDGTTKGSLYPDIVRSKSARPGIEHPHLLDVDSVDDEVRPSPDPVFFLTFEANPLDESADSSVTMKMGSMEIYYNKVFIEEITKFFKPPKTHMESFGALLYAAGATVEGITNQTRAGLEYALQEHKTLNAKLDLQAPLIILPSSVLEKNAPCLVLDAGHISVVSNLVDKSVLRQVQNKQSSQYQDEDYETLKALMYDKFQLNLEATQVLVGPSVEDTIEQLYNTKSVEKHFHIVDRINMNLLIEISILPKASNITKFRISGHLPVLHVSMSDVKYKILMQLISSSIPNLSFSDLEEETRFEEIETEDASKMNRENSNLQTSRPSAFTFTSQSEHERVVELDEFINTEDDSDDDTFVEADDGSRRSLTVDRKSRSATASAVDNSFEQRGFEFNFTVDRVQGSLYRGGAAMGASTRDADEDFSQSHLLVDIIFDHFEFMFYSRPYDMHAEVILGKLSVEDRIEENSKPEFSKLISSDSYYNQESMTAGTEVAAKESNLFHIKFSKVAKESPEYMSVFEGIDQNVEVSISTLNFVITRKSILTLLDFVAAMFSSPVADDENDLEVLDDTDSETEVASVQTSGNTPDKMKLKLNLSSIVLVLNDDGLRLATLRFDQADVGIFSMGKTMRVGARLGNFTLHDHLSDELGKSVSNQLVSIQGEELADFRYETFDPNSLVVTYPGYNSSIYFRSGSIKINFVDESVKQILQFLAKFAEMKTLYDSARQAAVNQAAQVRDPDKIHFDVIVRTPILVFSRESPYVAPDVTGKIIVSDIVTIHLGEFYIQNTFSSVQNEKSGTTTPVNKILAGLRQTRITSEFHFPDDVVQELQMIENLDINFKMVYVEHTVGVERPALEIVGSMSDVNLNLTESQYLFIIGLMKSLSSTLQAPAPQVDDAAMNMRRTAEAKEAEMAAKRSQTHKPATTVSKYGSYKGEAAESKQVTTSEEVSEIFTKMDFVFRLQMIALELFNDTDTDFVTSEPASLSKFALSGTDIKMRMMSDDSIESEFHVKSFTIFDSRQRQKNRFREIVPPISHDGYQFMASVSTAKNTRGGQDITAILSIDSPRFIFAIDYLFALKNYFLDSLQTEDNDADSSEDFSDNDSTLVDRNSTLRENGEMRAAAQVGVAVPEDDEIATSRFDFRFNVVDASVILIANPLTSSSEAIVLRIKEILMTQQNVLTMTLREVGIYLCRMDLFEENRLRILDDFNMILSIDNNSGGVEHKTSINTAIDPLVLRLSLRDILLALSIVNKAAELSPEQRKPVQKRSYSRFSSNQKLKPQGRRSVKSPTTTPITASTAIVPVEGGALDASLVPVTAPNAVSALLKSEEFSADFNGLRLVLIGGIHELPLLDLCVKQFSAHLRNWSSDVDADTSVEMFVNVYNYSKSSWEPLIEPWHLGFHMTRTLEPENMTINFNSRKTLELTITSQTVAMLSNAVEMMSGDSDLLSKPPDANAPYRIKNQTGYTLQVWVDNSQTSEYSMAKEIPDGEEVPWRFDDWRKLRENLNDDSQNGTVGIRLKDTNFDAVTRIQANKEGEALYVLQPKTMKVAHRLVCEVKLREDKVKHITFRSALIVENGTQIPIDMIVGNDDESQMISIVPGGSQAVPISKLYDQSFRLRPAAGFGYGWSNETLYWRNFLQDYKKHITCDREVSTDSSEAPNFYFQMCALYDKNEPLARVYPHMRIRITAPIEIENLLPYDFTYSMFDKVTGQRRSYFLRKGLSSPIHVAQLSHMLLLRVEMNDSPFDRTDFAIINTSSQVDFKREYQFATRSKDGQRLNLLLHYYTIPDSGGAFRVSIFSPYIILNKTGMNIQIKSGSNVALSRYETETGEGDDDVTKKRAVPMLFSYPSVSTANRALIKVGDSLWSNKPLSFEAIGSNADAVIMAEDRQREIHVGVNVSEGLGKYKLTKIVTITPRFILKNKLNEDLNIREPGSSVVMTIKTGEVLPLHFMQQVLRKQLILSYPVKGAAWSAPFNISEIGRTHVKVAKPGSEQKLIKIEILIEQATIFLHIDIEKSNWPYSIRNFSSHEFKFWQANPYITYDEAEDSTEVNRIKRFRPTTYRLPKRSSMPYAWDYPAAQRKELVISVYGTERHIPLAEIGNLAPMRVRNDANGESFAIDIDVLADGPIQTLVLSDYDQSHSLYKPVYNASQASFSSSNTSSTGFEAVEDESDISFKALIQLEGIGISLINTRMQELCYITFRGIEFRYNESAIYQTMSIKFKWIQIDNELFGGIYPIIMFPSVLPQTAKEMENHPTLSASITRVKDESHGVLYVKYATILLQQMTVEIDEDFLLSLLEFSKFPGASWGNRVEDRLCDETLELPEPNQSPAGQDVYFEVLHIQPAQMDLSFVRTEHINVEDKTSSNNAIMFFLNILTMAIGNINDAPVRLNSLVLENARVSIPMLLQLMGTHYGQQALRQVHNILGSADFLGNPVGLFNNLSSGVMDIFYEPYQGFIMTDRPQELGIGLAKGGLSFLKKSVFGVSDSIAKISGSISKGLVAATLDKQFQDRHRISRNRNRPKHALYGVTAGANSFVDGLASGISGIALAPMKGASEEGTTGFFKGLGKGLVGLPTKTAIGLFDLASNVSEGIRNTTTVFEANGIDRIRLPRFTEPNGTVKPYNQREAIGQMWLKSASDGDYFNEQYVAHMALPGEEMVVIVTYTLIVQINTQRLDTRWVVPFSQIQTVSMGKRGIELVFWGGIQGPFIPVVEDSARLFLYNKIGLAVEEYNRSRQTLM